MIVNSMAGKRIVRITVGMSEEDAKLFERVAKKLWPNAVMSRSAVMLSLARMCAKDVEKGKKKENR